MTINELITELEDVFYENFPNSKMNARWYKSIYSSLGIKLFLANDQSELSGGYWENDMFSISFTIDLDGRQLPKDLEWESQVPDGLTISCDHKTYKLTPPNKYLAYGTQKLSFRKSQNIVKSFENFVVRLRDSLEKDLRDGLIHKDYVELLQSKL